MSTTRLALLCAVGYLALSIGLGWILTERETEEDPAGAWPTGQYPTELYPTERYPVETPTHRTTTRVPRTTTERPTTTTTPFPGALRTVSAPNGLTTAIPADWVVEEGGNGTTMVARDPDTPGAEARFGGAPPTDPARQLGARIAAEATRLEGARDYRRLSLSESALRGHPAVRWEYEYTRDDLPLRVGAIYWEANGIEYVVYVAGPVADWATTRSLVSTMAESASP